jgi:ABC-type glycerol-3-phosphate transport system substrate-binding protein
MKKSYQKGLALLICLLLVCLSIVGCSTEPKETNTAASDETTDNSTDGAAATTAPANDEKVVIEVLSLKTEQGPQDAFNQMFESFQKTHPNVSFDMQSMSSDDLKTTLRARSASGEMPDIITWMKEVEPEYLVDLSGESFIGNLNADSVSAANAIYEDNKVFALPIDNGYIGLYYNKDVLASNGLEVPKTVSDLKNCCEVLQKNGVTPFASSLKDLSVPYMSLIALFSETVFGQNPNWSAERDAGQHLIAEDQGWKTAFDLHKEFVYDYSDPDTSYNQSYDDCAALLANGKVAFYGNGSWALSGIRGVNPNANIGLMAFPISDNEKDAKLLCFPDTSLSICAQSKNVDMAKEFLAYVASQEAGQIWSQNVKVSSTVTGVNVDYDPVAADINSYLTNNQFTPYGDRVLRSVFTDKLWEIYSYYMLGEYDWKTLTKELDTYWDKAVQEQ